MDKPKSKVTVVYSDPAKVKEICDKFMKCQIEEQLYGEYPRPCGPRGLWVRNVR